MIKPAVLGNAATDLTAAAIVITQESTGSSVLVPLIATASIVVGLWSLGSALWSLADFPQAAALKDLQQEPIAR